MTQLENLKEIADRNLGGLKADSRLLRQIKETREPKKRKPKWQPILIASTALVVLLCMGMIVLPKLMQHHGDIDVVTRSAGGFFPQRFMMTANVPKGSVTISEAAESAEATSDVRSLFARGQNANFPLIKEGDATYRLLTQPASISADQLGEQLGTVSEYTSEPAVSTGGVVSNVVLANQPVYTVKAMKGAAAAAEVDGKLRVFQRVSFSGKAVLGNETLQSVLIGNTSPVSLKLSNTGTIDDADTVRELMDILLRKAHYQGAAEGANRGEILLITLNNGLTVQMNVGSGTLSACGTWSCPEFFEAFYSATSD
jgi:hypothetical protein